jgi:hypothetical protein
MFEIFGSAMPAVNDFESGLLDGRSSRSQKVYALRSRIRRVSYFANAVLSGLSTTRGVFFWGHNRSRDGLARAWHFKQN